MERKILIGPCDGCGRDIPHAPLAARKGLWLCLLCQSDEKWDAAKEVAFRVANGFGSDWSKVKPHAYSHPSGRAVRVQDKQEAER